MGLNILFVNPNRFKNPPVIPIGLEYLVSALGKYNHNVDILDLCFSESPEKELKETLFKKSYDLVGFTIRNIDSLDYYHNEFFLPSIKPLIQCVKARSIPVVLGGSGFSAMPNEILEYFDGDYGILGPGEAIFPHFLELFQSQKLSEKIYNGWEYGLKDDLIHLRGSKFNYIKYLNENEIIGFETHKGCLGQCPYCIKSGSKAWYKRIPYIIEELRYLVDQGYVHFQLCDDEFNSKLSFSIDFCRALIKADLPLKWKLSIKPIPYNEDLFRLLDKTNAYNIGIDIASDKRIQKLNAYSYSDLENIIEYCRKYQIELEINVLVGYPHETLESVKNMINFFTIHRPKCVTIDIIYRIYNHTVLADLIKKDASLQKNLIKPFSEELSFLEPVFYNGFSQNVIEELISKDDLFRIAWLTPEENYQQTK